MIVLLLATTAIGTAIVAPWIRDGLVPLAAATAAISSASVAVLVLPRRQLHRSSL